MKFGTNGLPSTDRCGGDALAWRDGRTRARVPRGSQRFAGIILPRVVEGGMHGIYWTKSFSVNQS